MKKRIIAPQEKISRERKILQGHIVSVLNFSLEILEILCFSNYVKKYMAPTFSKMLMNLHKNT